MARLHRYIAVFFLLGKFSECAGKRKAMEGFIVGGEYTTIDRFPHAVYLSMHCGSDFWMCGASILNQRILITAAHCLNRCTGGKHTIKCFAGHEDVKQAVSYEVKKFKIHESYSEEELSFDLAISTVAPLPLGDKVKRIVIPNSFPKNVKIASVAGWGLIDDTGSSRITTKKMKTVDQVLRDFDTCESVLGDMEEGTFCAGEIDKVNNRPSMGDSGSGLIYKSRIQIGLVSYRVDEYPGVMVYTNVTHFYSWIEETAKSLYCQAVSREYN